MSNLDRPLSDIISENSRGRGRGGRGRGGSRGRGSFRGRGGGPVRSFRGGGFRPSFRGGLANGTGPIRRGRPFSRPLSAPYARPAPAFPRSAAVPSNVGGGLSAGARIMLSNLDPLITSDDCIEIFQNVGPVQKAVIHYNSDGTSQGTGEVQFANKNDALRAADEYDAAQVDGRPMYVKVIANKVPVVQQRTHPVVPILPAIVAGAPIRGRPFLRARGSGFRPRGGSGGFGRGGLQRGGLRGSQRGRGSFRGRGRGGTRQNKPTPTASQLDTDMDNYFKTDSKSDSSLAAGQPSNPTVAKKSKTA